MTKEISISWWLDEALRDTKSTQMIITAGYASGKSYSGWQWLLQKVRENPDCPTFYNSQPVHHLIRSVSIKTFEKLADSYGMIEGRDYSINRSSPSYIKFHNKKEQEILFISAENPEMIIGFESGFGLADEAAKYKPEALMNLTARNRYNLGNNKINQMLIATTTEGLGWFSERYDSDINDGWDRSVSKDHIKKILQPETGKIIQLRRFRAATMDNPFIPPEYVSTLFETYGHNQNIIKSYVYGYFASFASGLACPNYMPSVHDLQEEVKADPKNTILMSWDWNANPVSWIAATKSFNEFRKSEFVVHEESELGYSQIDDACLEFCYKFPVATYGGTEILVYGDPAGFSDSWKTNYNDFAKVKKVLNDKGYKNVVIKATSSKISERDTLDAINKAFYDNCVFINNKCIEIKKSLMQTKLKDNERKIDKPKKDSWTHKFDCLKYLIYQVLQKEIRHTQGEIKGFTI